MKINASIQGKSLVVGIPHNNIALKVLEFFWNRLMAGLMLALFLMGSPYALLGVVVGLFVRLRFGGET